VLESEAWSVLIEPHGFSPFPCSLGKLPWMSTRERQATESPVGLQLPPSPIALDTTTSSQQFGWIFSVNSFDEFRFLILGDVTHGATSAEGEVSARVRERGREREGRGGG